jgi:hypothetical protein
MSVHFMVHDQHGAHVAYSLEDVEKLKACGWRLREMPAASDAAAPAESAVETLHLPKRGPGRPAKPKAS